MRLKIRYLAFVLLTGCKSNFSVPLSRDEIYPAVGIRAGVDIALSEIDAGKRLNDKRDVLNPVGGLELSLGNKNTRVKLGGDVRYNSAMQGRDFYKGFRDIKENEEFSQINFNEINFIPFVGVERTFIEKFKIGLEIGFPYNRFEFLSGRILEGSETFDKKDKDCEFGIRYGVNFSYLFKEPFKNDNETVHFDYLGVGLDFGYESYDPRFFGKEADVRAFSFGLFLSFGF